MLNAKNLCFISVVRENEPRALKYYITEHIKSQLVLRNTSFCELPQRLVKKRLQLAQLLSTSLSVRETEFDSRAGQIGPSIANLSPPRRSFCRATLPRR